MELTGRCWAFGTVLCIGVTAVSGLNSAQAQLTRGFDIKLETAVTVAEFNAQPDLWALEVHFKKIRMISVVLTDPRTGRKERELVWYLVYKAINRPVQRHANDTDTRPVNMQDPVKRPLFVPEFTLVTNDNSVQRFYPDAILPEAQAAIIKPERQELKNSVDIVAPIPPLTPADSKQDSAIYGVAMWKNVHPHTDYFTIFITGFSNGQRQGKAPDGKPLAQRRTIVQEYWRPGDQFDPFEDEMRPRGEPIWIFRPEEVNLTPPSPSKPPAGEQK